MAAKTEQVDVQTQKEKTVLAVLDGSDRAVSALEWYVKRTALKSDKLILAYCDDYDIPASVFLTGTDSTFHWLMNRKEEKMAYLKKLEIEVNNWYKLDKPIYCTYGQPGLIVELIKTMKVDMVVTANIKVDKTVTASPDDAHQASVSGLIVKQIHVPVLMWENGQDHLQS